MPFVVIRIGSTPPTPRPCKLIYRQSLCNRTERRNTKKAEMQITIMAVVNDLQSGGAKFYERLHFLYSLFVLALFLLDIYCTVYIRT